MAEVEASKIDFGTADGFNLAVSRDEAETAASDFFAVRLANFGAYEDAMSADDGVLYHSMLSTYLY